MLGENIIVHMYIVSSHRPLTQNLHKGFIFFFFEKMRLFLIDDKEN